MIRKLKVLSLLKEQITLEINLTLNIVMLHDLKAVQDLELKKKVKKEAIEQIDKIMSNLLNMTNFKSNLSNKKKSYLN